MTAAFGYVSRASRTTVASARRHGHHDQVDVGRGRCRGGAGPEGLGDPGMARLGVPQEHRPALLGEGAADGGPDQPHPDHHDPGTPRVGRRTVRWTGAHSSVCPSSVSRTSAGGTAGGASGPGSGGAASAASGPSASRPVSQRPVDPPELPREHAGPIQDRDLERGRAQLARRDVRSAVGGQRPHGEPDRGGEVHARLVAAPHRLGDRLGRAAHHRVPVLVGDRAVVGEPRSGRSRVGPSSATTISTSYGFSPPEEKMVPSSWAYALASPRPVTSVRS